MIVPNYFYYQYFETSNQINIHYYFLNNYISVRSVDFFKSEYKIALTKNNNYVKIMCVLIKIKCGKIKIDICKEYRRMYFCLIFEIKTL